MYNTNGETIIRSELVARGLKNTYCANTDPRLYIDKINNNLIVFKGPYCYNSNVNMAVTPENIINCTPDDAFIYLINKLNNEKNIIVLWSKGFYDSSSEYIIYYNMEEAISKYSDYKRIKMYLHRIIPEDIHYSIYRYLEYNDGKCARITFFK